MAVGPFIGGLAGIAGMKWLFLTAAGAALAAIVPILVFLPARRVRPRPPPSLMPQSLLERLKIDEWDRMIDVNIKGVLYGVAAALPHMIAQKSGHFINVSSVAGHKVRAGSTVYSATKSAVRVISEGLRQEVKPYNIRTTIISPGAVATELPDSITDPDSAAAISKFYKETAIPARLLRQHGHVRDEPAGGRGRQRDPVPAYTSGILSLSARRFVPVRLGAIASRALRLDFAGPTLANTYRLRHSGVERIARHADKAAAPRGPLRAAWILRRRGARNRGG